MNLFENKYKIIKKIGSGCGGEVYKAVHILKNQLCAIKIEPKTPQSMLCREACVYQYLQNTGNFPSLRGIGSTEQYNYMVMDLLDISLYDVQQEYSRFSLKTTLLLGIQIIQLLKTIHKHNIIHRDIKPANFVFGLKYDNFYLYLIDFGLCIYDNDIDNKTKFIGNVKYASHNMHKELSSLYKIHRYIDDIISGIYIIIELYMGSLPWSYIKYSNKTEKIYARLKDPKNILNFCKQHMPHYLMKMITYVLNSKENHIDYDHMIQLLKYELNLQEYEEDYNYDWLYNKV